MHLKIYYDKYNNEIKTICNCNILDDKDHVIEYTFCKEGNLTMPDKSDRQIILETALKLTTGDRNQTYGDPIDNLTIFADLINAYFKTNMTAIDASIIMTLAKISRVAVNKNHQDNYIDGAAYMAIAGECAKILNDRDKIRLGIK